MKFGSLFDYVFMDYNHGLIFFEDVKCLLKHHVKLGSDSFLYRIAHFVVIWPTLVNDTLCHSIMTNAFIWLILLPESIYLGIIWWILGVILVICTPHLWFGEFWTDVTADVQMTENDRKMRTQIMEHGSEFLRAFCDAEFPMSE